MIVFYDANSRMLGNILRDRGVENIPVNFPPFSQIQGLPLIHCSTNTYYQNESVTIDLLLEL